MGWLKRKNTTQPDSPHRENGSVHSAQSAETKKKGAAFKDRFNNKNKWYWKFVQQRLPGWAPILTGNGVLLYFALAFIVCLAIGIPVLIASLNIVQESLRYDNLGQFAGLSRANQQDLLYAQGGSGLALSGTITIKKTMQPPIYVFYELGKYYQNHKRYVRSRADQQLGGRTTDTASACEPERYLNGASQPIDPCGLTAWSFFNDSYTMTIGGNSLTLDESNIAWSYDKNHLYGSVTPMNFNDVTAKRGGNTSTVPVNQNEHLMVWLRPAAKPTLRKLYAKINQKLNKGTVISIAIQNAYNTYNYGGQKTIVISTNSWVGGRNLFLGIAYLVVAGLNLIAALVFFCCYHLGLMRRRKFGDLSQLSWNRKQ